MLMLSLLGIVLAAFALAAAAFGADSRPSTTTRWM
jgi:hypothetical protein